MLLSGIAPVGSQNDCLSHNIYINSAKRSHFEWAITIHRISTQVVLSMLLD